MRETVEIMRYPVTLTPAPEGGYMVSLWISLKRWRRAKLSLKRWKRQKMLYWPHLIFYFEDNELIPLPSPLNSHDHFIEVPLSVASKVLLLNAFLQSEITQQELASELANLNRRLLAYLTCTMRQNRRRPACGKGAWQRVIAGDGLITVNEKLSF